MTVSAELREEILRSYADGEGTQNAICARYGISRSTLNRWRALRREADRLAAVRPVGRLGRMTTLNADDHAVIRGIIEADQAISMEKLQAEVLEKTGKSPSEENLKNVIRKLGIYRAHRKKVFEPLVQGAPRYSAAHRDEPPSPPHRRAYPSDLTDAAWEILAPLLQKSHPTRPDWATPLRELFNAVRYVLRSGCPWRYLPHDLPDYRLAHRYFRRWQKDGTWASLNDALREQTRLAAGKAAQPTAAILDSQSVKTTEKGGLAASTAGRRSKEGSGISSWTRWACSWRAAWSQPTSLTPTAPGYFSATS